MALLSTAQEWKKQMHYFDSYHVPIYHISKEDDQFRIDSNKVKIGQTSSFKVAKAFIANKSSNIEKHKNRFRISGNATNYKYLSEGSKSDEYIFRKTNKFGVINKDQDIVIKDEYDWIILREFGTDEPISYSKYLWYNDIENDQLYHYLYLLGKNDSVFLASTKNSSVKFIYINNYRNSSQFEYNLNYKWNRRTLNNGRKVIINYHISDLNLVIHNDRIIIEDKELNQFRLYDYNLNHNSTLTGNKLQLLNVVGFILNEDKWTLLDTNMQITDKTFTDIFFLYFEWYYEELFIGHNEETKSLYSINGKELIKCDNCNLGTFSSLHRYEFATISERDTSVFKIDYSQPENDFKNVQFLRIDQINSTKTTIKPSGKFNNNGNTEILIKN